MTIVIMIVLIPLFMLDLTFFFGKDLFSIQYFVIQTTPLVSCEILLTIVAFFGLIDFALIKSTYGFCCKEDVKETTSLNSK